MPRVSTARADMLRSAALLFRERGVEATSMTDVVNHAHAPRGSIYHHFPDGKPQLAEESTRTAGALMGAAISAELARGGPRVALTSMVDLFRQELLATDHAAGCPVGAAALEGVGVPGARAAAGESFASWEDTIAAGLWQRGVPQERARSMATTVIAAIEGALLLAKSQRSTAALDRVEDELTVWLEAALVNQR